MAQYDNDTIQPPPLGPDITDTSFMTEYFQKLVTAILSGHFGENRPPNATKGMFWAKDVGGVPVLHLYDGATDIPFKQHATPDGLGAGELLKVGSFGLGSAMDAGDLDARTTNGFYYGYGGAHVSASAGVNPFPDLDGLFVLLVTNHGLGGGTEYVLQQATSITDGAPKKTLRTKTTDANGWGTWDSGDLVPVVAEGILADDTEYVTGSQSFVTFKEYFISEVVADSRLLATLSMEMTPRWGDAGDAGQRARIFCADADGNVLTDGGQSLESAAYCLKTSNDNVGTDSAAYGIFSRSLPVLPQAAKIDLVPHGGSGNGWRLIVQHYEVYNSTARSNGLRLHYKEISNA